jgi:hypothetical protein
VSTTKDPFFERPVLNSPYEYPARHWELDDQGQPTQRIIERRRPAEFITPIPKPKKRKGSAVGQQRLVLDEGMGLSTEDQQYDPASVINGLRRHVDEWRIRATGTLRSKRPVFFSTGGINRSALSNRSSGVTQHLLDHLGMCSFGHDVTVPDRIYAPYTGDGPLPIPGDQCLPLRLREPPGTRGLHGAGQKRSRSDLLGSRPRLPSNRFHEEVAATGNGSSSLDELLATP